MPVTAANPVTEQPAGTEVSETASSATRSGLTRDLSAPANPGRRTVVWKVRDRPRTSMEPITRETSGEAGTTRMAVRLGNRTAM